MTNEDRNRLMDGCFKAIAKNGETHFAIRDKFLEAICPTMSVELLLSKTTWLLAQPKPKSRPERLREFLAKNSGVGFGGIPMSMVFREIDHLEAEPDPSED